MTRYCEVCGAELSPKLKRYCSQRCKAIAQTKEWQLIQELRRSGRVTLVQLRVIVSRRYGIERSSSVDIRISRLMRILRDLEEVRIL